MVETILRVDGMMCGMWLHKHARIHRPEIVSVLSFHIKLHNRCLVILLVSANHAKTKAPAPRSFSGAADLFRFYRHTGGQWLLANRPAARRVGSWKAAFSASSVHRPSGTNQRRGAV